MIRMPSPRIMGRVIPREGLDSGTALIDSLKGLAILAFKDLMEFVMLFMEFIAADLALLAAFAIIPGMDELILAEFTAFVAFTAFAGLPNTALRALDEFTLGLTDISSKVGCA